ncbi:hypothetical protein [Streptomyces azureus]|uniref:Uncharacterized protein n=1 Tax=Streptomyces azureus TaxID=146537 RepID=A0A0K8PVK3_STRAJ|nr:uncharacterized protein SAZU_6616 [Streptomyces azureus]
MPEVDERLDGALRLNGLGALTPDQRLLRVLLEDDPSAFEQASSRRLVQHRESAQARELIARCWAALPERDHGEARPALFRLYADITREAADRATR